MTINKPLLREGALLEANDPRGCLVEERFAQSKGLSLGDRLTVKLRGQAVSVHHPRHRRQPGIHRRDRRHGRRPG